MLTDLNQLPPPDAIHRPAFDDLVAQFKADYLSNIRADNMLLAGQVEATLDKPGELLTKMCETFVQHLLNEIERRNQQARQLLPAYANGSNLDNLVAHQGLERQVITEGDANAFPPVDPVMESDDALLLRYILQPHAPAAGSRAQYRASILTLDEKPVITVDKPGANQVTLTYTFDPAGWAAKIKDGNGHQTAPGQVLVTVLARDGDGVPDADLLQAVTDHFARDDVGPGTDQVTVQGAEILPYTVDVTAYIGRGPDIDAVQGPMVSAVQEYALQQHRLGADVQPDYIKHLLYSLGARRAVAVSPASDIVCTDSQAAYCTGVNVRVLRE